MSEDNGKKIYMPARRGEISDLVVRPSVPHLIDDALSIISTEILQFKNIVNRGKSLDLKQAKVLQGYIRALVELSEEARKRDDETDLSNMSDEDLIKMVETLKAKRQGNAV